MTDLSRILPDFPTAQHAHLWHNIDKHQVTTADLLTCDAADLAKRARLPAASLRRLADDVLAALHCDLGVSDRRPEQQPKSGGGRTSDDDTTTMATTTTTSTGTSDLKKTGSDLAAQWATISTLDATLDAALGGGIPTGYITEIAGESGAGKTQFLLTLLLAVQLPPPRGLGRPALYVSTEAPLSTVRLKQMLRAHPLFGAGLDGDVLDAQDRPSLDDIVSTMTPDLESQDHILQFQVPVEVARRNVGLLVLDSVAANYRAEFERGGSGGGGGQGFNMAARGNELVQLGHLLSELARKNNLAVVVANQVSDRFSTTPGPGLVSTSSLPQHPSAAAKFEQVTQESPLARRTASKGGGEPSKGSRPTANVAAEPTSSTASLVQAGMPEPWPEDFEPPAPPALLLDHQQRWFTGWGDDPFADYALKTPSLGLLWSKQVACRIALVKRPVWGGGRAASVAAVDEQDLAASSSLKTWRRYMKVVFAPHVAPTGQGLHGAVEFEVTMGGIRGLPEGETRK